MKTIQRTAHAKVNLALHVVGQRADGYHLLDSLVAFTQFGDEITITCDDGLPSILSISIDGPFAEGLEAGANNLVYRAAMMLATTLSDQGHEISPVQIHLEKKLPIASGIGGGSTDAAATLIALKDHWAAGMEIDLKPLAEQLGADVTMCLHARTLRARGIGHDIDFPPLPAPLYLVLVNPGVEVSTPDVFKTLTNKDNPEITSLDDLGALRNDLQQAAIKIEPAIGAVLDRLAETSPVFSRMSGSGATCFGVYETQQKAEDAAQRIAKDNPHWWCVASPTTIS
ncbi:MAG: 4-(cytidine 5'-diphospho)-2-C-methyl-D-erythritol kinase [Pseudomonadota bacterium]